MAAFLGIEAPRRRRLPAAILVERLAAFIELATGYVGQIPPRRLGDRLPGRARSLLGLGNHVVAIGEAWLEVSAGAPFDATRAAPEPATLLDSRALAARAARVARRLRSSVRVVPWRGSVETFYGQQTHHAVIERCTWHAAQHTRQLAYALGTLDIEPAPPLDVQWLAGLPLPEGIWDG